MSVKLVSQLDQDGYFVGSVIADESPVEPGEFLIPGGAVDATPPSVPNGKRAKFIDGKFVMELIPKPVPEPIPEPVVIPPPTPPEVVMAELSPLQKRIAGYLTESDPLFFKAQRGEATMDEWRAKVEEIKARYPDIPVAQPATAVS